MTVKEMHTNHPDMWLLVTVTKENTKGEMIEGEILHSSKERDDVYEALEHVADGQHVAIIYTGEVLKEGEAFAF